MARRLPLGAALACAVSSGAACSAAAEASPWTFHDPTLASIAVVGAQPELIASGFAGCEGPQWIADAEGGHLRFAGVHTDVAFRWDPRQGLRGLRAPSDEATVFRPHPAGGLIVAEQGTRRIVRYEADGRVTPLVERFEGKRLNRPNDVAVHRDGSVWFTDPDYLFKLRPRDVKELPGQYVFRFDPEAGALVAAITELRLPNGIAFSPSHAHLYVGDAGRGEVWRWTVAPGGALGGRTLFAKPKQGAPDGIATDAAGNVWICGAQTTDIYGADGTLRAELRVPGKRPAAVALGGARGEWLFIATREALWRLPIAPVGLNPPAS